jgi:hypothetical protein
MNDNALRGPQWRKLLGEFFTPRYGGTPQAWGQANWKVAVETPLWEGFLERNFGTTEVTFSQYEETYAVQWVQGMFQEVGLPWPDEAKCVEFCGRPVGM